MYIFVGCLGSEICVGYMLLKVALFCFFFRRKSLSFTLGMSPVSWTVLVVTSVGCGASFRFVNLHLYSLMWELEVDCTGNNIFSPLDFFLICIIQSAFSMTAHTLFWQGHLGVLRSSGRHFPCTFHWRVWMGNSDVKKKSSFDRELWSSLRQWRFIKCFKCIN